MGAFCGVGSGVGDGGLTGGDVRGSMKRWLRRYVRLSSVCTRYDFGVLLGEMTSAGVHLSPFESWIHNRSTSCRRAAVEAAGAQCGRGTFSVLSVLAAFY